MATRLAVAPRPLGDDLPLFSKSGKAQEIVVPAPEGTVAAPVPSAPARSVFNSMYSVGHQLMKARQARLLSIEDVAFETRIPHHRLRDMENDNLSNFANLTYAKGFLKLYSKFLHLDLSDYLDEFDTSAISAVTGHEYIQTASAIRILSAPTIAPDQTSGSRASLAGLAVVAVILVIGGWIFVKSRNSPLLPDSDRATPPPATEQAVRPPHQAPLPPPGSSPALAKANSQPLVESTVSNPPSVPASEILNTAAPAGNVRRATVVDDYGNEIAPVRPAQL